MWTAAVVEVVKGDIAQERVDAIVTGAKVADELGARSVAFPAIATGAYGFPSEEAARIAVATIKSTPTKVELIRLAAFDDVTRGNLAAALAGQA